MAGARPQVASIIAESNKLCHGRRFASEQESALFSKSFPRVIFMACGLLTAALLSSCGGGGDARGCTSGCDANSGEAYPIVDPSPDAMPPSSNFANICTSLDAKQSFVLTYMNENYLWYSEMVPPFYELAQTLSVEDYFYYLLAVNRPTDFLVPAAHPVDTYSYVIPVGQANILDSGYTPGGYGFSWVTDSFGNLRVSLVVPNSPADRAGMQRGGVLTGGMFDYFGTDLYPYTAGASMTFDYQFPGAAARSITLNAVPAQEDPVPMATSINLGNGHTAGYLLFTRHSSVAQDRLIDAISGLRAQGINDLVLDLRYNQGGFLYAAQSLASMIAGTGVAGRTFEQQVYNGKVPNVTLPFVTTVPSVASASSKYPVGATLPMLTLPRVYILTSGLTASASESIINALQGANVDVVLIGTLTAGKPYGANRRDNCNDAFYPVEYQGFNDAGFGNYSGGFTPTCLVHDDFNHALGDSNEALLSAAIAHIKTGQCPPTTTQN